MIGLCSGLSVVCLLVRVLVGWLPGSLDPWFVGCLFVRLFGWLVVWLVV